MGGTSGGILVQKQDDARRIKRCIQAAVEVVKKLDIQWPFTYLTDSFHTNRKHFSLNGENNTIQVYYHTLPGDPEQYPTTAQAFVMKDGKIIQRMYQFRWEDETIVVVNEIEPDPNFTLTENIEKWDQLAYYFAPEDCS